MKIGQKNKTSSIQKYIDDEPKIAILDLTEEQFCFPLSEKNFLSDIERKAIAFACTKSDRIFSAKELADYLNYNVYTICIYGGSVCRR